MRTKMQPRHAISLFAAILSFGFSSARAESPNALSVTQIGSLACTTSDAPPQAAADAELSCRFHAFYGEDGSFNGFIARRGAADVPQGRRVLVWSVLAQNPDIAPNVLSGTYTGVTGGNPAGRLVGGESNAVVLEPVTLSSQIGDAAVPTVLQLRLEPTKA
jgi:hypothetical protein